MDPSQWKWPHYYWNFLKHLGQETYRTWRWELFASVPVGLFVAMITGGWKDFRTMIVATGLTLSCFIVWHAIRLPWLIHKRIHGGSEPEPGGWFGMFGILVIVGVFIGGYEFSLQAWNAKPLGEISITLPSADPGAKNAEIAQDRRIIAALRGETGKKAPLAPLRCRAEALANEIEVFNDDWNSISCGLNVCEGTSREIQANEFNRQQDTMRKHTALENKQFQKDYLYRVQLLSAEFKQKRLNTSILDQRVEVTAVGNTNGFIKLIASELAALAGQLPQVECGVIKQPL